MEDERREKIRMKLEHNRQVIIALEAFQKAQVAKAETKLSKKMMAANEKKEKRFYELQKELQEKNDKMIVAVNKAKKVNPLCHHGNIRRNSETSTVNQTDPDNHLIVDEEVTVANEPSHHSTVEVTDGGDQEEETITTDISEQLEGFQSSTERQQAVEKQQQNTSKQVVNNQQEMPRVTSIDWFKGMKPDMTDEAIKEQQTADKPDMTDEAIKEQQIAGKAVHQNLQEISSDGVMEDNNITEAAILTYENNDHTNNTETSLQYKELLTNPQQCCSSARSLSQSPRIVSLQVELGFVSGTCTDVDLLQSKSVLATF